MTTILFLFLSFMLSFSMSYNFYLPCHPSSFETLSLSLSLSLSLTHTHTHTHISVNKSFVGCVYGIICYLSLLHIHRDFAKIPLMTLGREEKRGTKAEGREERSITFPLADVWAKETLYEITASKGSKKFPGCQSRSHQKKLLTPALL